MNSRAISTPANSLSRPVAEQASHGAQTLRVAVLIFDGVTALDVAGPVEVLWRAPNAQISLVGQTRNKTVHDERTHISFSADVAMDDVKSTDVLLVPGGPGILTLYRDQTVLEWLKRVHPTTRLTLSVCTGSLALAAAGLLSGAPATTHWASREILERLGARYQADRYVEHGKIITSAGVSAGIDMSLYALSRLSGVRTAQAVQLSIEYDPAPPFDCGSPARAGERLTQAVLSAMRRRS